MRNKDVKRRVKIILAPKIQEPKPDQTITHETFSMSPSEKLELALYRSIWLEGAARL